MEIRTTKKLDAERAALLDESLKHALADGETVLTINMDETTYICSAGLRAIISAQKKINRLRGSMVLCNVKPQIMEIFEVTGFGGALTFE